jgi:hypothetical protein
MGKILISHRGNINGPNPEKENHPDYIKNALHQGYDVEIDIWYTDKFMLGHDRPKYELSFSFLEKFYHRLWIHCKNIEALIKLKEIDPIGSKLNYFWHEKDTVTLTSKNNIWAYPGKQPIKNSIAVIPEIYADQLTQCNGFCSDYIKNYKK